MADEPFGDGPLDAAELTELGEQSLPALPTLASASITVGRRRLDTGPVGILVLGLALIGVGGLGGALAAARSGTAPSPTPTDDVGILPSTPTPAPTASADPCAAVAADAPAPVVTVKAGNQFGMRRAATAFAGDLVAVGFPVPATRPVEAAAGSSYALTISEPRCVREVRVEVHSVGTVRSTALSISDMNPTSKSSFQFFGPPAGDWVMRVALRLGSPSGDSDRWGVYLWRLNSGYVPYESPYPPNVEPPPDDGTFVTPELPCGSLDPPPAELPITMVGANGVPIAGTPVAGPNDWQEPGRVDALPADLPEPVALALGEPLAFRIAGQACAVRWTVDSGPLPAAGAPFLAFDSWAGWTDNPSRDPAVAAQNVIEANVSTVGEAVVHVAVDVPGFGTEAFVWRITVDEPPVTAASVAATPAGDSVGLVRGCGASFDLAIGAYANEQCVNAWQVDQPLPELTLVSGSTFRLRAEDGPMRSWFAEYADADATIQGGGPVGEPFGLGYGGSEVGLATAELPAPPVGRWLVRISLQVVSDIGTITVPYFVIIDVPA